RAGVKNAIKGNAKTITATSAGTRRSTAYSAIVNQGQFSHAKAGATASAGKKNIDVVVADEMPAKLPFVAEMHPPTAFAINKIPRMTPASAPPEAFRYVKNRMPSLPIVKK